MSTHTRKTTTETQQQDLIPNLPYDMAVNCVVRTPIHTHISCRLVCKRWNIFFSKTSALFRLRKTMGLRNPYLFTFACHPYTDKLHLVVFDLTHLSWSKPPSTPCPHASSCSSLSDSFLACSAISSDTHHCPLHSALGQILKKKWHVATLMLTPRWLFGSGVIDGKIYTAGGCTIDEWDLSDAEVFDPVTDRRDYVADMRRKTRCFDSCVLHGKLYVKEDGADGQGQVYDPRSDVWEDLKAGMAGGWTGPSVVVYGKVFVVSEKEGMRVVTVYDERVDEWRTVEGPPVPDIVGCLLDTVLCGDGQNIYVVRDGLRVVVGYVHVLDGDGGRSGFGVRWKEVTDPVLTVFSELEPSGAMVMFA